ncbi:MAG: hypothetical protein JNL22_03180 [Bacteroidales bacterium]|nr:hypothetical protein [Bacteroidales bacterium]
MKNLKTLFFAIIIILVSQCLFAQQIVGYSDLFSFNTNYRITGTITNASNSSPVQEAQVNTGIYTSLPSDYEGHFNLFVPFGFGYQLTITAEGYETLILTNIDVDEDNPITYLDIQLMPIMDKYLHLTLFFEGLFNQDLDIMNKAHNEIGTAFPDSIADAYTLELRDVFNLDSIVFTINDMVSVNGISTVSIPGQFDESYYFVFKHRNSIETWSSVPISFNVDTIYYDLSDLVTKAYGFNMKLVGNKFNVYGGDVNQDGTIDTGDMSPVDNDASEFAFGYIATDVNGDGIVDTGDMTIVDNNSASFIGTVAPTPFDLPVVTTAEVSELTYNSAVSGGEVISQGGSAIISRGVCWSLTSEPTLIDNFTTDGYGYGEFTSFIENLEPNTTYYVRAYATNGVGTSYGQIISIHTYGVLVDIDGNIYKTVIIGSQNWMAENLKTTRYKNGTNIIYPGSDNTSWLYDTTGAFAWYNNDISWKDSYGALYNFCAVKNSSGLCPSGWHVPSDEEWTQLTDFITGGTTTGGSQLKSCRQENSPLGIPCNTNEHPRWDFCYLSFSIYNTNDYSFSALPGGARSPFGDYIGHGNSCVWWTSSYSGTYSAWEREVNCGENGVYLRSNHQGHGFSVRCVEN